MNARNWPKFLGLIVFSFMLLMQYQNCAPAHSSAQTPPVSDDDNMVHIMGSVNFSVPEIHMAAASGANLSGSCDTSSSDGGLNWEVRDPDNDQTLAAGSMACTNDQFSENLPAMPQLTCQKNLSSSCAIGI